MADVDASSYFVHMQEGGGIPLLGELSTLRNIPFGIPRGTVYGP